jgi:hypothetical protein
MDLVAITDHDGIDGALTIADRPDVIVGCEVTGVFANDSVRVHLGVLGVTEAQHAEIRRLRHNVAELLPYLRQQLRAGRVRVGGRQGHYFTMASDIVRIAAAFQQEHARGVFERPLDWRRHAMFLGATFVLPFVAVPLTVALAHFILEMRFNRELLFDLVERAGRADLDLVDVRLPEVA